MGSRPGDPNTLGVGADSVDPGVGSGSFLRRQGGLVLTSLELDPMSRPGDPKAGPDVSGVGAD